MNYTANAYDAASAELQCTLSLLDPAYSKTASTTIRIYSKLAIRTTSIVTILLGVWLSFLAIWVCTTEAIKIMISHDQKRQSVVMN